MLRIATLMIAFSSLAFAQQSSAPAPSSVDSDQSKITVRGCLRSERGNYILIEDKTGSVYALQGVGNKLQGFLRKQVELTGETKPGNVKTGIRPEKSGSNPADTVHSVDGVPMQVNDVGKDIRVISKHCKAADQQ